MKYSIAKSMMRRLLNEWGFRYRRGASAPERTVLQNVAKEAGKQSAGLGCLSHSNLWPPILHLFVCAVLLLCSPGGIEFQLDTYGICGDRIWNIDETSVALLPVGIAGWRKKGSFDPRVRWRRGAAVWDVGIRVKPIVFCDS